MGSRTFSRALVWVLLATGLPAVGAAPVATGWYHPLVGPHIRWTRPSQPTTSDCLAAIGIRCYSPIQIQQAYDMGPAFAQGKNGAGKTIAIVDAFGSPTIATDLAVFDAAYGLPDPPSLQVVTPAGSPPPFDPNDDDMWGWALETSLDVEYAHAMAPGANILLVVAASDEDLDIANAERAAVLHYRFDVMSQSFGETESLLDPKIRAMNTITYTLAAVRGVSVLASTGDSGSSGFLADGSYSPTPVVSDPASSPLNTAVGGTALTLDDSGSRLAPDVVWNETFDPLIVGDTPEPVAGGGGVSSVYPRPIYQLGTSKLLGRHRGLPDVSLSASVDGGVLVFESYDSTEPDTFSIWIVGGTSEATPEFAGIVADADQAARHDLGLLNPLLYTMGLFHGPALVDITSGDNTVQFTDANGVHDVPGYSAGPGYDLASGLGTVDGSRFISAVAHH